VAFLADGGGKAVSGMHDGVIGKSEEFADERLHDFFHRAAPQIGAADAARKERVTREKDRRCDGNFAGVGRKKKAGTARRVARGMNDLRGEVAPPQGVTFAQELVNFGDRWRLDAEKAGLHLHSLIERNVVPVHQNWSAGIVVKSLQAADVVDVRVRADDSLYREFVAAEQVHDAVNFIAGIEDDSFARDGIADDRAVALQQADRNREVQEALAVLWGSRRSVLCSGSIRHAVSIAFGLWSIVTGDRRLVNAATVGRSFATLKLHRDE